MPKVSVKVTISLPEYLYRAMEDALKKGSKSRSALMQDALLHWLRQNEGTNRIRKYEAGYRKNPECKAEVTAAKAAAVRLLAAEEW